MKKTNKNVNLNKQKIDFKEILKQIQKRDDGAFFGQCVKFKDNPGDVATVDRAVQFLWLKDNNVGRNEALHFGKRRICKIDSTKQFDGPISARIMPTQKLQQGMINGWHNGASDPKYKLGDDFKTEITKTIDNQIDKQQYDDFAKHEKKELQETQKNLDHIQRFYEELIEKYNFGGKNTRKLHSKLQELKEANRQRNNTPLEYVEHQGQRFFHILNDITDYLDRKIQNKTILHEMHAFQSLTSLDKKLKIKFLPLGDPMVPTEKELIIQRQSSIALNTESLQSFRKRACTQLFSQQYNKKNRVFQIQQVPTMNEQEKQNKYNNIIESLQRNGMNTPKEVDEGDQTYRNRRSKYQKNGSTDFQFTQLSKKTISALRSKSNRASPIRKRGTTIDDERTNVLEQRINRYVQGHLNSQHNSVNMEVDNNNLRDKYQQLLSAREKEYYRIYGKNKEIKCNDNILFFLKQ